MGMLILQIVTVPMHVLKMAGIVSALILLLGCQIILEPTWLLWVPCRTQAIVYCQVAGPNVQAAPLQAYKNQG